MEKLRRQQQNDHGQINGIGSWSRSKQVKGISRHQESDESEMERGREPISRNRSDWPILFLHSSSIPLARSFGLCAHYWPFDGDPFWTIVQQSTMREKNIVYCGTNLAYFLPPKIESILSFELAKMKNSTSFFFQNWQIFYTFKYFWYVCVWTNVCDFFCFLFPFQTMWCSKEIRVIMDLACTKRYSVVKKQHQSNR